MKNSWLTIALAIIVIGGGMLLQNPGDQTAAIARRKATATPTPANQNYNQLVQQYRTDRIQFSQNCQAVPATMTVRNGTAIMLDNRSSVVHNVTVNGTPYSLAAYGYQIVTLNTSSVPGIVRLNCDSSVNVSTVNLSR